MASAILNEAALNSHNSVGTAPRRRTAVTIVASQIKLCGSRHFYTRVIIRLHHAVNGVRKLREGEYLPKCSSPGHDTGPEQFLSPDRRVWCGIYPGRASCVAAHGSDSQHWANLYSSGRVKLCNVNGPISFESDVCTQNWAVPGTPILQYGRTSKRRGVRCASTRSGITCIKVSGPGKGHGFRVNKDEAVEIGK